MARKIVTIDEETKALPAVAREAIDARIGAVGDPKYLSKTEASATYAPAFPASQTIAYTDGNVTSVTEDGITTTYTYNPDGTVDTDTRQGVTRKYTYTDGNLTGIEVL